MSGAIEDLPLRVCAQCRAVYMEDDHMYDEPQRCPRCNADPDQDKGEGEFVA